MTQQIRVLQIIGKVVGGGVESVILNYYRHIDHKQVQFDFVVDGEPLPYIYEEVEKYGGKVFSVTPYSSNIIHYMADIYHIVKEGHYDIIHSNMNTMSGFSLFAAQLAGAKVRILHNHTTANKGEGLKTILKYILRPIAKWPATHYCACSALAAEWMYGAEWRKKCHIIYNAIDVSRFLFREDIRKEKRAELHIKDDQMVIGHVGRFMYQKNHDFIIELFKEVLQTYPNAVLLLLGEGPLQKAIKEKVKAYHIESQVYFLGVRTDVNEWLQAMDVFLFPSWYEGLGMAAVEAQISGLPTLMSTYVPKEAKVIENAWFLPLDKNVWVEQLKRIQMQPASREVKKDHLGHYDISTEAQKLMEYYQQLISKFRER